MSARPPLAGPRGLIPAIPTVVDGLRFRSRLEAKWWTFFRLLGWLVEYEPLDLSTGDGGYIPDFLVRGAFDAPTIVECKPFSSLDDEHAADVRQQIDAAWHGRALLVGVSPIRSAPGVEDRGVALGWCRAPMPDAPSTWWTPAHLTRDPDGLWIVVDEPRELSARDSMQLMMHWHVACNRAQWKGAE